MDTKCDSSVDIFNLLDDDQYQSLKRCLMSYGKGRRPNVPSLLVNNRLLLQLFALKIKSASTFQDAFDWLERLSPGSYLDLPRFKYLLEKSWNKAQGLLADGNIPQFVEYCGKEHDFEFISGTLNAFGLNRKTLLHPETFSLPDVLPAMTNRLVVDLELFRKSYKLKDSFVSTWIDRISGQKFKIKAVSKRIDQVLKNFIQVQRRKSRSPEQFSGFLEEEFILTPAQTPTQVTLKVSKEVSVQTQQEVRHNSSQTLTVKIPVRDASSQTYDTVYFMKKLKNDKKDLQTEVSELSHKVEEIHKTRLYRSNFLLKRKIQQMQQDIVSSKHDADNLKELLSEREIEVNFLKKKCLNLQKDKSRIKRERDCLIQKIEAIDNEEIVSDKLQTRDGRHNKFSDDIRMTVMGLCATGVPSSKCGELIEIVAKTLFHQNLDLPHWTTTTKWIDEFNVVSKVHIAEECLQTSNITLHTDATSREKRRFVGQQITLADGSIMSLGYSEVAVEDAQTLLETTMAFLDDLCDVMEDHVERDDLFKQILRKITSTMSDRASVMKCFNRQLNDFRKSEIGQEINIQFLYCNAHFLLGLSSVCEESLKKVEDDLKAGTKLGRDSNVLFNSWGGSEGATARAIRTSADCLGPRGDEKSGCREEWLAYCRNQKIKSTITSYRSNRFNNLFHNAEAIILLKDDITDFLDGYASSTNLKLRSILLDFSDARVIGCMCALALLHKHVSGPYWHLVNSHIKYLELPPLIQIMEKNLRTWSKNIDEFVSPSCKGIFNGQFHDTDSLPTILERVHSTDQLTNVKLVLQQCLSKMVEVTERQLNDFLPGGVYGGDVDERIKDCLKNCPITNLSGEHAFGDLDYDLSQRRHATLHNRSTRHMLKWNDDVSWLEKKNAEERENILRFARKKKTGLKTKFKKQEDIVKLRVKAKIIKNHQEKLDKERKLTEKKEGIVERVLRDGGICKTKKDVGKLNSIDSIKAQLQYHKVVLGAKGIKITGDKLLLRKRLETYLETGDIHLKDSDPPPPKRRKIDRHSSTSSSSGEELPETESVEESETFTFDGKRQGLWVAVYYDDSPYIGQVINIIDHENATVKFLTSTKCQKHIFKWPSADDIATIHSNFVFMWDLDVLPESSDGRTWRIMEFQNLMKAYQRIQSQALE